MNDITRIATRYQEACKLFGCPYDTKWLLALMGDDRYSMPLIAAELADFNEYWSDRCKRPKSVKLTIRNWLRRSLERAGKSALPENREAPAKESEAAGSPRPVDLDKGALAVWNDVVAKLHPAIDAHAWRTWYAAIAPVQILRREAVGLSSRGTYLVLWVPNKWFTDYLTQSGEIQGALPAGWKVRFVEGAPME